MLLDTELIIKRISIVVGILIVAVVTAAVVWYNTNLNTEFVKGKTETIQLRLETVRIGTETDSLKSTLLNTSKELKSSISTTLEETKKIDNELKHQMTNSRQQLQEYEKYKLDTKQELNKLKEINIFLSNLLKEKEQLLIDQIKLRDAAHEKFKLETKSDILILHDQLKNKDKDLVELKNKLDKEIEWRNKNIFIR